MVTWHCRYQGKIQQLEEELMRTKELLVTYEQSTNRKDHIISNLTRALQGQKNKCSLQQSFSVWKLKMCDEKREVSNNNVISNIEEILQIHYSMIPHVVIATTEQPYTDVVNALHRNSCI